MEQGKRNIKKQKLKLRKGRLFGTILAAGLAITGMGEAVKNISEKISHRDSIYYNEELVDKDSVFNYSADFDNFRAGEYYFNEDINVWVNDIESNKVNFLANIPANRTCIVYDSYTIKDESNNNYFYCEDPVNKIIGLISANDFDKGKKIGNIETSFSSIFQIDASKKQGGIELNTCGNSENSNIKFIKNDEVIFADEFDIKYDNQKNLWMKSRTSNGDIGYVKITDDLKEIQNVALVQVIENSNEIIASGKSNLSENVITDISAGDRMIIIGDGKSKNSSYAIYYDEYGIARFGEISNSLIESVELDNFIGFDVSKSEANDIIIMNQFISEWNRDITSGVKGIDISDMHPDVLNILLMNNSDIEYGIVRLGSTGYGKNDGQLVFVESSNINMNEEAFLKVKQQVDELRKQNKKVFAYYYATDINIDESNKIVDAIEDSIDRLGGGIIPILDYEFSSEEKEYDRNFWVQKPNYDKYINQGGIQLDFDTISTLDAIDLLNYIESHPEVQSYINFCQTEKAKCIAYTYKRLYDDGYLKSKNALLYTGNGHFSKDTYKAEIKFFSNGKDGKYESVVLAKLDEVKEYLTNPQSPYFISEDYNLKVWYADYSGKRNDKMFGNDCAMLQTQGDIEYYGDAYDLSYACKKFIDSMDNNLQPQIQQEPIVDDWEIG